VAVQDKLNPDWFSPVRESVGAALLMNGAAADAEKVFPEDLDRNPRNPRSLFGLQQALKAQKQDYDAGLVEKQFQKRGGKLRAAPTAPVLAALDNFKTRHPPQMDV
jgi:hypothetical protein